MSLFLDSADLNSHGRYLAQLLLSGGVQLEMLANKMLQVTFDLWVKSVRLDVKERGIVLSEEQAKWLWEALTREPRIATELGSRIVSAEEQWQEQKPVFVLKAGENLGLFLKPFSSFGASALPLTSDAQPQARIKLLGALDMKPGKITSRRFECCDVECTVEIVVDKPGTIEQEAVLMKVEPSGLTVDGSLVTVSAGSLNHAFTLTSRRLQPHRRSHGGRAYDHVAWRNKNQWIPLETIRGFVENGKWGTNDLGIYRIPESISTGGVKVIN